MNTKQTEANRGTILIADDDDDIRLALELLLCNEYQIIQASSAKETIILAQRHSPDLILLDMNFSRDTTSGKEGLAILGQLEQTEIPIILMTAWANVELAVQGLKKGAVDFIEKPWNKEKLTNSIRQQLAFSRTNQVNQGYRQLLSGQPPEATDTAQNQESNYEQLQSQWVSQSASMQAIDQLVSQIAPTDANILILGDNGTGKSLLAERIHQLSIRKEAPFIATNMAAIPESLFESELFGHQKGAFTDAKQSRIGRFELAEKGSLFLDEIGSLPLTLQPKLLRVLETGQYESLGSSHTQQADVRIISATNADLKQLVEDKFFRQDLLYRLNTLVITIPSLTERLDDIAPLADCFIAKFSKKYAKEKLQLTDKALEKLCSHQWPGNIRELSHVIERAVLLSSQSKIDEKQLLLESSSTSQMGVVLQPLDQAERQLIEKAMEVSSGHVTKAAKILDISRNALYRRLEKFNLMQNVTSDE